MANRSLQLTAVGETAELRSFWSALDRASAYFVGEEYPKFVGDPRRSAFVESSGQRHMAAQGGVLGSLANKYMVGVTPGYHLAPGYGGNLKGKSADGVNAWRAAFLAARAKIGVAGFAVFEIHGHNGARSVMNGVLGGFGEAFGSGTGTGTP
jgi:hypothetical protein